MNMERAASDHSFTLCTHTDVVTFDYQWGVYEDAATQTCRHGYKLLIELSGECFMRETVTPYLLMRQKPFCIRAALTGYMLIVTNGSKESCCYTHWEVIWKAATWDCSAAAGVSLTTVSLNVFIFFFSFFFFLVTFSFFLIPHNFIFSHFSLLFISHFPFLIFSLAMQFNLIAKLTWFCLHGANVLKHVTVLCQPCICLMAIQTPQFSTFTFARVRTPRLKWALVKS